MYLDSMITLSASRILLHCRPFSVFRRNAITEQIVVFASGRKGRPKQTGTDPGGCRKTSDHPPHDENCPFCLGNEHKTPKTLFQIDDAKGKTWECRVVRNAFPAVSPPEQDESGYTVWNQSQFQGLSLGPNSERPAIGHHEVIIESPMHNSCTSKAAKSKILNLVRSWHVRGNELAAGDKNLEHIVYFKNQGAVAGASLIHPHAQLVGLPFVPRDVRVGQLSNMNYFLRKGRSVFDRVIEEELSAGERIIERNEEFISFVPFAATSPFNVWIMPLKSRANFLAAGTRELDLYAEILSSSLNKLDRVLSEPDMNILLKSAPLHGRHNQAAFNADCYFRWYTTITPRLGAGAMAGFELGSGIFSNGNVSFLFCFLFSLPLFARSFCCLIANVS